MNSDTCKQRIKFIVGNRFFEWSITVVIIVNALLIGVELKVQNPTIRSIQQVILWIFTAEILMRFIARDSVKSFFKNGWNIFDLTLVLNDRFPPALSAMSIP